MKKHVKTIFDFKTIKTFEDACKKLSINPEILPIMPGKYGKPLIAAYKLMIIYEAINDGWVPDWKNYNQYKYYPWFDVLSSGFGFSDSGSAYDITVSTVGSRLCTNTSEKVRHIAGQFKIEYQDYFLLTEF